MNSSRISKILVLFSLVLLFVACSEEKSKEKEGLDEELFTVVEELPSFEGGFDSYYYFIKNEIKYPKDAREKGVEGKVEVEFVIERDGSVSEVKTLNGIGNGCDQEAERVIAMSPNFIAGRQRGRTVRVRMSIPIEFKLDKESKNSDGSTQGMVIIEEVTINKESLKVEANYADGTWVGNIYDASGQAMPGASIIISGTTSGTVSDLNGSFEINAPESSEVIVSFVGYESTSLGEK